MEKTSIDKKIEKLEAELKNAKATKSKTKRTERNNQIMGFGIMLEMKYKSLAESEKEKIRSWAENLDLKNKERVLNGFKRLDKI